MVSVDAFLRSGTTDEADNLRSDLNQDNFALHGSVVQQCGSSSAGWSASSSEDAALGSIMENMFSPHAAGSQSRAGQQSEAGQTYHTEKHRLLCVFGMFTSKMYN